MLSDIQGGEVFTPRNRAERRRSKHAAPSLRPRYLSITEACRYAGVGRSKFYDDFLARLETLRIGRRNLIELASLDELLDELANAG
jgi:hypothetical protein